MEPQTGSGVNAQLSTRVSLIRRLQPPYSHSAWEIFVTRYQPFILAIGRRMGLSPEDAAEATQEVLFLLVQKVGQWSDRRPNATFRGWLYRLTRNVILRQIKGAQSVKRVALDLIDYASASSHSETMVAREFERQFLDQVFHDLAERIRPSYSEKNWQAFWRTFVDDLPVARVAADLEMSVSSVYVARCRILERFRQEAARLVDIDCACDFSTRNLAVHSNQI
jgi:RNA polymerase sigma-70 factor (ECF subfamily)